MKNKILGSITFIICTFALIVPVFANDFPILTFEQANPGLEAASRINREFAQISQNQQQAIQNRYQEAIFQEKLKQEQLETQRMQNEAQDNRSYIELQNEFENAIPALEKLAKSGSQHKQYLLATAYYYADNIMHHYSKALYWYKKVIAHKGNMFEKTQSENTVGLMYFWGMGVKRNREQALNYFIMSAKSGNASSQAILGAEYHDGVVVPSDPIRSYAWFSAALYNNDTSSTLSNQERALAQKGLREIFVSLSVDEKQTALQLTKQYVQKYVEPFL